MNPYLILILAILIGSYLLDLVVNLLNLSHIKPNLPDELKNIYNPTKYKKSQTYLKTTTRFSLIKDSIALPITLAFILLEGFNLFDLFARSFGANQITTGLIFFYAFFLFNTLIDLPFSLYSTFVIEQKFGFNQTTIKTFFLDLLKSIFLFLIIGSPLIATIIWLFSLTGSNGWILAWIFVSLFQLILMYLAPIIIMPLFNKFTPLKKGELKTAITNFAKSQNFTIQGIYTMDGSKRSSKANAFFTGFGRYKRIVLFDTLIKKHTTEELVAILAHEIGHYKKKHILQMLFLSIITTGFSFYLLSLLIGNPGIFAAFKMDHVSIYASLIFVGFLFTPISDIISIASNALSRHNEFQADHFAVTTYKKPKTFITALKKLSSDNLTNLTPHPLKVFLEYSHPPILQRIQAIKSAFIPSYS